MKHPLIDIIIAALESAQIPAENEPEPTKAAAPDSPEVADLRRKLYIATEAARFFEMVYDQIVMAGERSGVAFKASPDVMLMVGLHSARMSEIATASDDLAKAIDDAARFAEVAHDRANDLRGERDVLQSLLVELMQAVEPFALAPASGPASSKLVLAYLKARGHVRG